MKMKEAARLRQPLQVKANLNVYYVVITLVSSLSTSFHNY